MSRLDQYIEAAERENTRRSYASAIRHFEVEWKGLLPTTSDSVARYLADHAVTLSINTLRQRLAALSRWHADQGFADPTKSPMVRQVLKGIRAVHPASEKRARPLALDALHHVNDWLDRAFTDWTTLAGLSKGPVFRKIDRWGHVADEGLHPNSLIPLLRSLFTAAGIAAPDEYSSHSLRRGFAGWARSSGWDLKDLMEYVGWKDIKSAMRYLDTSNVGLQARFEQGLASLMPVANPATSPEAIAVVPSEPVAPTAILLVKISLTRFNKLARGLARGRRLIEQTCFERYAMQRLDADGTQYELTLPCPSRELLDETVYALLDDMYRIADDNQCLLEATFHEPATGSYWD